MFLTMEEMKPSTRGPKKKRKSVDQFFQEAGTTLGYLTLWFIIAITAGLPIALIGVFLRTTLQSLYSLTEYDAPIIELAFQNGIRVGLASITLFLAFTVTPLAWRYVSGPKTLRGLAYATIQAIALGVGLLVPDPLTGFFVTYTVAGAGSTAWWIWQKRWRGTGVAPSPLAGVLRPEIHTGQIWFAVISGSHDTKVRPIIVLGPAANNRWTVAYFTTQSPKEHLSKHYIPVPLGKLRGLPKDNWLSLRDPRELTRSQFRTYTGLAPSWLYTTACVETETVLDPHALTIQEFEAGEGLGPVEKMFRNILKLSKTDEEFRETVSDNMKALMQLQVIPHQKHQQNRKK